MIAWEPALPAIAVIGTLTLFLHACAGPPQGSPAPIAYQEDFEAANAVSFWTAKGSYSVNYAGLSTERSLSGTRSFKLDITFHQDGDYNYWAGPTIDLASVPGMRLSGSIYLEQAPPQVSVSLGTSYYSPAYSIMHGGEGRGMCQAINPLGAKAAGRWVRQETDVAMVGDHLMRKLMGEVPPGVRLEKWTLQIFCRDARDARLVLYVDDITIEGDVPETWDTAAAQHLHDWEIAFRSREEVDREQFRDAIAPLWNQAKALNEQIPGDEVLAAIPPKPWGGFARELLEQTRAHANELVRATDPQQAVPTDLDRHLHDVRDRYLAPIRQSIENLRALKDRRDPCLVLVQDDPISNFPNLPNSSLIGGRIGHTIEIFAAPSEYEPAGFIVLPSRATTATFRVGDLRSGEHQIGSAHVDLRVVKAWYQAGVTPAQEHRTILTPELLLHDDDLVKVDHDEKRNVVRDIDAPRDASELQPVSIQAHTPRQFWLTVRVPAGAVPGRYEGTIAIALEGLPSQTLTMALEVLPIDLEPPRLEYGLYYRGQLATGEPPYVSSDRKTPRQLEAELRNMKDHGFLYPDVYERCTLRSDGTLDTERIEQYLRIREQAGLSNDPLYYLGISTTNVDTEEGFAGKLAMCRQFLQYARSRGIQEVYFYGQDEAMGDALREQRAFWEEIHAMGGKIWVACATGFFDVVGDLLDLPVVSRQSPGELPRVHALGRKVWNYGKSYTSELPFSQRYYMGHWLVRSGMDGNHTYAYQHAAGPGQSGGRPWDDYDHAVYRSLNFAYPTVDGVVDTLQWEGAREGVDDARYAATLDKAIKAARASGSPRAAALADAAQGWIDQVDITGDLRSLRRQMADRIIELNNARK